MQQHYLENKTPIESDEFIEDLLNKGFIYGYKRDRKFRPILVISLEKLIAEDVKLSPVSFRRVFYLAL